MILIVESWDLIHEVLLAICNFNVEIEKKKFNWADLLFVLFWVLDVRDNKDGQESSYFQSFLLKKELESNNKTR